MSSDLLWLLTNKNSSFLVKRNGIVLSREPGNLLNRHSLKYSGLAPSKTIHISSAKKGLELNVKKTKVPSAKVSKATHSVNIVKAPRSTLKSIKGLTKSYRPDLRNVNFILICFVFLI